MTQRNTSIFDTRPWLNRLMELTFRAIAVLAWLTTVMLVIASASLADDQWPLVTVIAGVAGVMGTISWIWASELRRTEHHRRIVKSLTSGEPY